MEFTGIRDFVATVTQSWEAFEQIYHLIFHPPALLARASENPSFAFAGTFRDLNGYNSPEVHRLEIGAANGICTARSLAAPFNALLRGNVLSQETRKHLQRPLFTDKTDLVLGLKLPIGMGFMYIKNGKGDGYHVGHSGLGDQLVAYDVKHDLAFAYVSNSLKFGFQNTAFVSRDLVQSIYDCI